MPHQLTIAGRARPRTSLLIACQWPLLGRALARSLAHSEAIRLDTVACSDETTITAAARTQPHVVLYDSHLPQGPRLVYKLLASSPESTLLVLGAPHQAVPTREYIAAGAVGYIAPDASLRELTEAVLCASIGLDGTCQAR